MGTQEGQQAAGAVTAREWQTIVLEQHEKGPARDYPLATVLNPRRNISIKRTAREIRIEVGGWIVCAAALTLLAYATYQAAMEFLGK